MEKRDNYKVIESGTTYQLPKYKIVDNVGLSEGDDFIELTFVRGDKTDNGVIIPRVEGVTHEQLLGIMIEDLQYKNNLVPSKEGALAITKLQEALMWMEERSNIRLKNNTIGTYQK